MWAWEQAGQEGNSVGKMMFLSQAHLLKGSQEKSGAAAETRAVNERAVIDVVLRVGQHDQVSHSLVNGSHGFRR
jgi:hypothetical protein